MFEESDDITEYAQRKKSKLPLVIGALVLLIVVGVAGFFMINRMGSVSPNQLVGTWAQSPQLGTWIPRFEFREDGTGQFYQFNTDHNVVRNAVQFEWDIRSGNMMYNEIWPEMAEIRIVRGAPPRFRYRLESSESWQEFVKVVYP